MRSTVPIITANCKPLRFVLRATDTWSPTLDEINSRQYDYVKLHRLSTFLDVGIAPFSVGVCFDGTLVLPAAPRFAAPSAALAQFNTTLADLLIGGLYCEAVVPDDLGYGGLTLDGYSRIDGGAYGYSGSFHRAARTTHIGTLEVIRLLEPETVSVADLQSAFQKGRDLVAKLGELPRDQVLYGATFYARGQWAESLIHTWTITERILELCWQRLILAPAAGSTRRRRDFLADHRAWTASTKLEVLFQKGLIPPSTYETIDRARQARNDFVHNAKQPSQTGATQSMQGCFELASLCASDFKAVDLFSHVTALAIDRCRFDFAPRSGSIPSSEVRTWLAVPPLPGDENWGDREYEVIPELSLQPLKPPKPPSTPPPHRKSKPPKPRTSAKRRRGDA